ncbi:vacuolar-sorting protein Snf7p [Trichomonascus vanleenenianus]|uniref:ESCRT-III subunit protein SNF7 n=1 Tax=Trichomonascus vanleenenianus TaxID=2268995 RepID=UPI003ECABA4D
MFSYNYWFGGSAKQDGPKKAIVRLRMQKDTLGKKEKHLQAQIEEQDNIARKNVTNNKALARTALKRKKMHQNELEKIQGQLDSIEVQLNSLENANLNHETMKAMHEGAKAMKQIHGSMNIDKVDATMDDIRDQVALGEEIRDAMARPLGQEYIDEDELNEELQELEQAQLDETMVKAGRAPANKLPTQTESISSKAQEESESEDEEAEELRKLQAEMAL